MTAGREDGMAGALSQLRTSHADREQAIDVLKAAFVQGRLTKDEFDLRVGQVFASRTYADLDTLTAGIPDGVTSAHRQPSTPVNRAGCSASRQLPSLARSVPARAWLLLRRCWCRPASARRLPACCSWA